ncbi:MAG: VanZ family protein [Spirosomaceae bacterium]|nr:VanZ family protein [Spirosomataceae bacterium]
MTFLQKPYLALAWSLVILGLCSLPGKDVPDLGWDKLHHFGAFGIMSALWYWAKPQHPWAVVRGLTLYGFFIEIWQHVLPIGRTFDLWDGIADALGVIVAIPIAKWCMNLAQFSSK